MSNFYCEKCGVAVIDSPKGYVAGCEHYPPDIKPLRDFGSSLDIKSGARRRWYVDEYGTKRWFDNDQPCGA